MGVSIMGDKARSIIAQAIKRVGDVKVGEVLAYMVTRPPAEPISYFVAATTEKVRTVVV
jgi:hypothetical protein